MTRYRNIALACTSIIAILIAWVVSGCASGTHATKIETWRPSYDADYAKVCACWKFTPVRKPYVIERKDCMEKRGYKYFATPYSPTGYATGIYYPAADTVEWCDARAIIHELSHAVRYWQSGRTDVGANDSGRCWL